MTHNGPGAVVRLVRTAAGAGIVLTAMAVSLSGCGYSLAGRGNFLPAYVKTIGVPSFVNHSTVAGIDVAFTDEVRSEFVSRGLRVEPDTTNVDAVVTATITGVTQTPTAINSSRQASKYGITVTANVQFIDKHDNDKVLWSNPAVQVQDQYDATTGTTANDPGAFLASSANALQRLAHTFAQSVVTSILEAF